MNSRREPVLVALFACLVLVPFMGKAYHNDEPFFLAAARHILSDPFHPLAFNFTWYGHVTPAAQINTTPPVLLYLLALALKLTGGGEFATRLAFLPLDLLAAASLYLLASRFLKRPLLPVLIAIAAPAYLINMNHLMAEKPAAAFGFACLCAAVRGVDDRDRRWYRLSALLLAAAIMSKYVAVIFLLPAVGYGLGRGKSRRDIAGYCCLALAPVAGLTLYDLWRNPAVIERALSVTADSSASWWSAWSHKLRSFLAFTGGCGLVTAFWPLFGLRRKSWLGAALLAAVVLFLPVFDIGPAVRPIDRLTGIILAAGALSSFAWFFSAESRTAPGWAVWGPWLAAAALFQVFLYWSIMARVILFLLPPLILGSAETLEARWDAARLRAFYGASLAGVLAVSFSLAWVDYRYAAAQKEFAREIAAKYLAAGRRVWFSGYMGLEYYLEGAGGRGLDFARGGWDLAKRGDVVVALRINTSLPRPNKPILASVFKSRAECAIPLRLISGWDGEGGFYSNLAGFLPYSVSREPLEEFAIVEIL